MGEGGIRDAAASRAGSAPEMADRPGTAGCRPIYSIGHSNVSFEEMLGLLHHFGITLLLDVRSIPYSKYTSQFNREQLERGLPAGIEYVYLGSHLGGRASGAQTGSDSPPAQYEEVVSSPAFRSRLLRVIEYGRHETVCLICAEEDPRRCHRSRLLASVLLGEWGLDVQHIRHDGRTEAQSLLETRENQQLRLFA
jgi:uncharacterized protein (DUF488 family)